ncbi:hypothetical protein VTH82DRAFT_6396 [Thermothelomyces myriococcoides]
MKRLDREPARASGNRAALQGIEAIVCSIGDPLRMHLQKPPGSSSQARDDNAPRNWT